MEKKPSPIDCLVDRRSFYEVFKEYSSSTKTYQEAYEKVEHYVEEGTGRRRYSSYESFRVAKTLEQRKRR